MSRGRPFSFYLGIFALVLTLPLIAIITFVTNRYVGAERTKLEAVSIEANIDLGLAVERDLIALIAALRTLAASPALLDDLPRFRLQAQEAMAGRQGRLILLDETGRDHLEDRDPPLPAAYLAALRRRIAQGSEPEISDLLPAMPGHGRQIAVSVIAPASEIRRSALVFAIQPTHFAELLQGTGLLPPHRGSLVDRSGTLIARTLQSHTYLGRTIPQMEAMTGAYGRIDAVNVEGIPVRRFYRRSPVSGWYILTSISQSALQSSLRQSLWLLAAVALSLLLTACPCALFLTRRMQAAARITMGAARGLGQGALIQPRSTGVAEADMVCQILADASARLQEQAESLRNSNVELERRVADRTRELAQSHALTQSILENTPDTVKVLDAWGRVIFTNLRSTHLTGPEAGTSLEGQRWADFWPGEGGLSARRAIACAQRGASSRFTAWRGLKGEAETWLDVLVTPMLDAEGGTQRILAISRDITAQHRHDEELQIAKERAEAASVAKEEFLANMSHELRTPLNGILGYADLLSSDRSLLPSQRHRIDRIQDAAGALLAIVNDILDLAKIEAGDMTLQMRPFRLAKLLDDAADLVLPMARSKALSLDLALDPAIPEWVEGDPERLRQVVLNLLGNAIKFTQAGGIHLGVTVEAVAAGRCRFEIAIRDTGMGIAPERQHLLFQRFSQVDASNERRFGGTGLGLAISRHLVEEMGGRIAVESAVGLGSTFRLSLDLPVTEEPERLLKEAPLACNAFEAHVLVVEDVALNRDLVAELLKVLGCRVDLVGSGEAAIRAVQETAYDLVLMDEQMPEMSGTAATRIIRALDHPARHVPIVACSADVFAHQVRRFEEAGMNGHVGKPLTQAVLAKALIRHVFRLQAPQLDRPAEARPDDAPTQACDSVSARSWLPDARLDAALDELRQDLAALDADLRDGSAPDALAARAHALISTACMLDFPRLGRACQDFERAARSGSGRAANDDLRRVIGETLAQIDDIRPAGATQADRHDGPGGGHPDRILDPASAGQTSDVPTFR
ncbi:ATP-binding protein [Methylobacterium soli]|uniref:ATP-binding protein n=1 Tax=Methylobacterium soli TaxID=553447 RepID=UPI001783C418|nr:ATP-binding protein [Methylobacterium soli]